MSSIHEVNFVCQGSFSQLQAQDIMSDQSTHEHHISPLQLRHYAHRNLALLAGHRRPSSLCTNSIMDVDFCASRIHSAKHLPAVQAARLNHDNHLAMDDSDTDDDRRACFPCPFCYMDIEVHVLCSHLQDEHCFDFKNAVCPLCAANLGKDATGHFMAQHTSSLKRRRKSEKSGLWIGSSAMLGKDLSSFLGSSTNGRTDTHDAAPDPLLSPFLRNVAHSEPKGSQDDKSSNRSAHLTSLRSSGISSPEGGTELDYEERKLKAEFVQQLIASTIFYSSVNVLCS